MNKVWLIMQREFLTRVTKKSFLITTVLVPLIFPAIIGGIVFFMIREAENAKPDTIQVLDESHNFTLDSSKRFTFIPLTMNLEDAKRTFQASKSFGLLHIPASDSVNPSGITLYTKESQSIEKIGNLEKLLTDRAKELQMAKFQVDKTTLEAIRNTNVSIREVSLDETGEEKDSNNGILYGAGMTLGILIYMFVLIYGIQIMQGVIDEKSSKIIEVIVSSVKPFQLMLGKILGIASVGLLQFLIWIILITVVTSSVLGYFGMKMPQQQMMEQVTKNMDDDQVKEVMKQTPQTQAPKFLQNMSQLPFGKIAFVFLFYFLGGYLMYGALFAAVGSSVDSIQESQQFQFPITLPLLIGYMGLFTFVLRDPHGQPSFWLSIIPFTSPVAMVGRIAFNVPDWQLALSMLLLVGGFLFTTWIAGRIYRVGILMSGTKVSYKVLFRWFMQG